MLRAACPVQSVSSALLCHAAAVCGSAGLMQAGGGARARSHTCFNTLLIPHYASRKIMAARLRLAIMNSEGFGLE